MVAPPAVNVAGVPEQTNVELAEAVTGNGATGIFTLAVAVPQALVPVTV